MRSSRSKREALEVNGKHLKLIQAESDSTNLGHTIADRTAGNISGDVAAASCRGAVHPSWGETWSL
jgi:hypothetical protein